MWLHGNPDSVIVQGNTLANPLFKDDTTGLLKTFDYAVANPPFSNKNWSNGLDSENDIYKRFEGFGTPPKKNGDYAFLLHFIKSLKSKGKGAIILPLGVLFRGNAEAEIRKSIIDRGYIKGIIGLPANLFYGTGIAASIIIIDKVFAKWQTKNTDYLKSLEEACLPKKVIQDISDDLIKTYKGKDLIDKYDIYQHLMDYWAETMQDDLYELTADGWKAGNVVTRLVKKAIKKGAKDKEIAGIGGLEGQLIPPKLIIQEYFQTEQNTIDNLQSQLDGTVSEMEEIREEHGGEEGLLTETMNDKGNISKATLKSRLKEIDKRNTENAEEFDLLKSYKKLMAKESKLKADIKKVLAELEIKVIKQYPKLNIEEIKNIVVDKKWMANIEKRIKTEMDAISHQLTERIKELAERYEIPFKTHQQGGRVNKQG